MIVTLVTGGLCGLIFLALSLRVVVVRRNAGVELGDGGDTLLLGRIRAHANFAEYVPICLVLIAAVELSYDEPPPVLLWVAGLSLVVVRLLHAVGMDIRRANAWRVVGIVGTWVILAGLSLWALYVAATY